MDIASFNVNICNLGKMLIFTNEPVNLKSSDKPEKATGDESRTEDKGVGLDLVRV